MNTPNPDSAANRYHHCTSCDTGRRFRRHSGSLSYFHRKHGIGSRICSTALSRILGTYAGYDSLSRKVDNGPLQISSPSRCFPLAQSFPAGTYRLTFLLLSLSKYCLSLNPLRCILLKDISCRCVRIICCS